MKHFALLPLISVSFATPALADNGGKWTEDQVTKYCHYRAVQQQQAANKTSDDSSPLVFERCMNVYTLKIGADKDPGMISELNKADMVIGEKAQQKSKGQ